MFCKQKSSVGWHGKARLSLWYIITATVIFSACIVLPLSAQSVTQPSFQLNIAKKAKQQGPDVHLDWTKDLVITETEPFYIQYRTRGSLFVYLVYEGNDGVVTWLDPRVWGKNDPLNPNTIRIPGEDFLTSSGSDPERIYLVVLPIRDQKLESGLTALANLRSNASTRERNRAQNTVLDEIDRLRRALSGLAREPEKPVAMAGTARSASPGTARPSEGSATPPTFQFIEAAIGQGYVKTIFIRKK